MASNDSVSEWTGHVAPLARMPRRLRVARLAPADVDCVCMLALPCLHVLGSPLLPAHPFLYLAAPPARLPAHPPLPLPASLVPAQYDKTLGMGFSTAQLHHGHKTEVPSLSPPPLAHSQNTALTRPSARAARQ